MASSNYIKKEKTDVKVSWDKENKFMYISWKSKTWIWKSIICIGFLSLIKNLEKIEQNPSTGILENFVSFFPTLFYFMSLKFFTWEKGIVILIFNFSKNSKDSWTNYTWIWQVHTPA
jgi:hypothetical protein